MGPFGPALVLACHVVLAAVLAIAAVAKIADRRALPARLEAMGIAPGRARAATVVLPMLELVIAILLVFVPRSSGPPGLALFFLFAFTLFLVVTVRRAVPCPCFGTVRTSRTASVSAAVVRNGVLMAEAVIASGTIDGARPGATVLVTAILAAITTAVVVGVG